MKRKTPMRARTLVLLASFLTGAAAAAGACNDTLPSDQTSSTSTGSTSGGGSNPTTTSSTTTTSTTASSGGTGGAGTGGSGTGGSPDCFTNPMTHVEIINACTTAQEVDLMPVLPLLDMDGGLPPLP
jgi:hypothetical protein